MLNWKKYVWWYLGTALRLAPSATCHLPPATTVCTVRPGTWQPTDSPPGTWHPSGPFAPFAKHHRHHHHPQHPHHPHHPHLPHLTTSPNRKPPTAFIPSTPTTPILHPPSTDSATDRHSPLDRRRRHHLLHHSAASASVVQASSFLCSRPRLPSCCCQHAVNMLSTTSFSPIY